MSTQWDLFDQPPPLLAKAHPAEDVTNVYQPPEGPPEYQAAFEMLKFIDWLKLNDWQKRVLWPHLTNIVKTRLSPELGQDTLRFELGYIVGTLECEQLRTRSAALEIAKKYGVTF